MEVPVSEIEIRASRSSGPGGQHANKTESRVVATFDVAASETLTPAQKQRIRQRHGDTITATAQDTRSQARNRELAIDRVRSRLAQLLAPDPPKRRPTRPSRSAKNKRMDSKRKRSVTKTQRKRPEPD